MVSARRPMCENCHEFLAKKHPGGFLRFCSNCYRLGVSRRAKKAAVFDPTRPLCPLCESRPLVRHRTGRLEARCGKCKYFNVRVATIPPIERPANLVDTGLRILDRAGVLVTAAGKLVGKVPPAFVFDYFFETVGEEEANGRPLVLRVLKPQGACHVA